MKFVWISVILVILSCDKLETSPLPKTNDLGTSPWSSQVTTKDEETISRHTTTVEFEVESDETTTPTSNFEEYEDVKVIISKNDSKNDQKIVENENSPFSPKTHDSKRIRKSTEFVPNYGIVNENDEDDPGKVFITRVKRPPQPDNVTNDENPAPISIFRKKNDKNKDDTATTTTDSTSLATEETTIQETEPTTEEMTTVEEVVTATETPNVKIRSTRESISTAKDALTTEEETSKGTTEGSSLLETTVNYENEPTSTFISHPSTVEVSKSTTFDSSSTKLTTITANDETTLPVTPLTTEETSFPTTTEQINDESSTKITTQDRMMTSTMPISVQTETETPEMTTILDEIPTLRSSEDTTLSSSASQDSMKTSRSELTVTTTSMEPVTTEDTTLRASTEAETTDKLMMTEKTSGFSTESATSESLTTDELPTKTSKDATTTNKPSTTDESTIKTSSEPRTSAETPKAEDETTKKSSEVETSTQYEPTEVKSIEENRTQTTETKTIKSTESIAMENTTTITSTDDQTTSTKMTEITELSTKLTTMGHQIMALEDETSVKTDSSTSTTTEEDPTTIEVTTLKLKSTPLTHADVFASQPHYESLVTKKRSIEKTDANDLTSSSSALHESSDRLSSTEKVATATTLEEIETNTLKSVETTLETPISKDPEQVLTTNALTTNSIDPSSTTTEATTTTTETSTTTSTTESTTESTTPKNILEPVNRNPDPVQCNTSPVFAKGDSIVGGASINDISDKETKTKGESESLCTSMECIHSASRMLSRMNLEVNPCDDFYEFSCGKFLAETHVPSEKSNVDIFSTINDNLQQQLQTLLSEPIDDEKDIAPVKVVKKLFKACMNRDLIERRGSKPLMDLLHLLGGWPILTGDSWSGEHWTWGYTVARMKMLGVGVDYIIEMTVLNDFTNSSKRIVYLDQASTELDKEFIKNGWNDQNVLAYFEFIKDVALALGADPEVADREAREIVNFEISLGQISASKESRRELSSLYNPITIRDLQHKHPYLSWLEYINLLLPPKTRVTNDQIISLADVTFFKKLGPLLDNTPKRVLANYLLWHATSENLAYLTENLQKLELKYRSKTSGKNKLDSQWKECVKSIAPKFKVAIGAKYAREYFREDSKKVAVEMVSDIKAAFKEIIQSRVWMDNETRDAAMDKLERMSVNIAYPNELMDDQIVIDYYKGLHVKEDEYFESQLRSDAFLADKSFERLHEPVNNTDWRDLTYVAVVNAFYHPLMNYIMFPAGILQEHFFQADRPRYMNYAAIGFVIGHEITHGFDDMGSQFDVDGNLRNWWQAETLQNYQKRAQCMVEQYGNFTDPEVNVTLNGIISQGENIADNGGLKEAYYAYQRWVQKNGDEAPLPGLNYSTNQLFWISAAQTWCTKYKPEALKYAIITDSHSPGRFRVMGPFMNSEAFAKDFECPRGSRMNPVEKCEVW